MANIHFACLLMFAFFFMNMIDKSSCVPSYGYTTTTTEAPTTTTMAPMTTTTVPTTTTHKCDYPPYKDSNLSRKGLVAARMISAPAAASSIGKKVLSTTGTAGTTVNRGVLATAPASLNKKGVIPALKVELSAKLAAAKNHIQNKVVKAPISGFR